MAKSMTHLFATAGNGPAECALALEGILERLERAALRVGIEVDINCNSNGHGVDNALISLCGKGADSFALDWTGTVLWQCPSPLRKGHKRKNWFIGIFQVPEVPEAVSTLPINEVVFETCRAGGPGGQHQNTTDSAVRARWGGYVAMSRSERSQHRNKAVALSRLAMMVHAAAQAGAGEVKATRHTMHHQIERGAPMKRFKGRQFRAF